MTLRAIATASLCGLLLLSTGNSARAQDRPPCGERADILRHLKIAYDETVIGLGIDAQGRVLELLVSPTGDTWSILITRPGDKACLVASGIAWNGAKAHVAGDAL